MSDQSRDPDNAETGPDVDDPSYVPGPFQEAAGLGFNPAIQLAMAVLRRSLPAALRAAIKRNKPIVALLEIPGESWKSPVTIAAMRLFSQGPELIRPASSVRAAAAASDRDILVVRRATLVIASASDLHLLPSEVVAAVDARIRLTLTPADVRAAMKRLYGRGALVRAADIAGLDFRQVAVAFRPATTPRSCIERLRRSRDQLRAAEVADDVATLDRLPGDREAMRGLRTIAADVIGIRDGAASGDRLPSILLFGAPGTGKTMLARSFAKTVGLPFLQTSVGDWLSTGDGHLGAVVTAARQFFDQAIASAPCVVLVDEIDALPDRASIDARHREWWTSVITCVLIGIDRMRARDSRVVLIGATNHIRYLDAALIRPGRLDRHLEISGPRSTAETEAILRFHLRSALADADLGPAADIAFALAMTGAALENAVRTARAEARAAGRPVRLEDLVAVMAPPDPRDLPARARTAIHEAAHAIIAHSLGLTVQSVSIVRAGVALGVTTYLDGGLLANARPTIQAHIVSALAGRAADVEISGAATAGAMADLKHATRLLAALHGQFGLGDTLISTGEFDTAERLLDSDPELKRVVGAELDRLMGEARKRVRRLTPAIQRLAMLLLERRVASAADVAAAFDGSLKASFAIDLGELGTITMETEEPSDDP